MVYAIKCNKNFILNIKGLLKVVDSTSLIQTNPLSFPHHYFHAKSVMVKSHRWGSVFPPKAAQLVCTSSDWQSGPLPVDIVFLHVLSFAFCQSCPTSAQQSVSVCVWSDSTCRP